MIPSLIRDNLTKMPVQKMTKCPVCHGAGRTAAGKTCRRCKGSGEINSLRKDKTGNFREPVHVSPNPAA